MSPALPASPVGERAIVPTTWRVNLHIRIAGRANWRYALLFRDYLREHPSASGHTSAVGCALVDHRDLRVDDIFRRG